MWKKVTESLIFRAGPRAVEDRVSRRCVQLQPETRRVSADPRSPKTRGNGFGISHTELLAYARYAGPTSAQWERINQKYRFVMQDSDKGRRDPARSRTGDLARIIAAHLFVVCVQPCARTLGRVTAASFHRPVEKVRDQRIT